MGSPKPVEGERKTGAKQRARVHLTSIGELSSCVTQRYFEEMHETGTHTPTLVMSLRFYHYRVQMMLCWAGLVPTLVKANITLEEITQRGFQLTLM